MNNYKFFQHNACEYFPCHDGADIERFNCMFCFCPLYGKTDCGGDYNILNNGIKDCSTCTIPHSNYDYIIYKLTE